MHLRIHHILSGDCTPFLHSHPFGYLSIVFRGGYTEQVLEGETLRTIEHRAPAIIGRRAATYHRIVSVAGGGCKTLFLVWGAGRWGVRRHPEVQAPDGYRAPAEPGIYRRQINGRQVWSKFEAGTWFVGDADPEVARRSRTLSVHQATEWGPRE